MIGPQKVLNSGSDDGIQHLEQPYVVLKHNSFDFCNGPGAAQLTTNSSTGFLGFRGRFVQCIALQSIMTEWPEFKGQSYMVLEGYLRPDQEITNVSLNGIFLDDP